MDQGKFDRLIVLLDEAEDLASQFTDGYSNRFIEAEEFHKALKASIEKLKSGDLNEMETLWLYFAPTCSWDDFIGKDGIELGNEVYELLISLRS